MCGKLYVGCVVKKAQGKNCPDTKLIWSGQWLLSSLKQKQSGKCSCSYYSTRYEGKRSLNLNFRSGKLKCWTYCLSG